MNHRTWGAAALAAAIALGSVTMFVQAADEAKPAAQTTKGDAKPAAEGEKKPAAAKKPAKLVKPWSGLTSLNEEQTTKILAIHRKALDEINAIKDREEAEITALLTDAQKGELKALVEADNATKKAATPKKPAAKEGDAPAKEAAPAKAGS